MRRLLLLSPLVALSLLTGCPHKETKQDTTPTSTTTGAQAQNQNQTGTTQGAAGTCSQDVECGPKQLCIRGQCVDITPGLAECSQARVHFDFDSSEIKQDERSLLDRLARCLKADHALHVTIEGNADERGTQQYNLSLGDRRATAVAKYFELLGVSKAQLKTVSYGKENPLCAEHDEDCWSKNRRDELKPAEAGKSRRK